MSGMAEVLRKAMHDHRVLWEIGLDDDCEVVAKCESCGYLGTELETWEHQANVAAETLTAAGFGPVQGENRLMQLAALMAYDAVEDNVKREAAAVALEEAADELARMDRIAATPVNQVTRTEEADYVAFLRCAGDTNWLRTRAAAVRGEG